MGYTHYWSFASDEGFSDEAWAAIVEAVGRVLENSPVALSNETRVDDDAIVINGAEPDDFETLVIRHDVSNTHAFGPMPHAGFVKTQWRPYDVVVCATLLILRTLSPDVITIYSDGEWDGEWIGARALASNVLPDLAASFSEQSKLTPFPE